MAAFLPQFIEKFQEVKEATRSGKTNGTIVGAGAGSGGAAASGGVGGGAGAVSSSSGSASATASPLTTRAKNQQDPAGEVNAVSSGGSPSHGVRLCGPDHCVCQCGCVGEQFNFSFPHRMVLFCPTEV